MKILRPTHFNGILELGGSTKPWKLLLLDDGAQYEYVVKLFSDRDTEQIHPVAKEVIGSELARELGLYTPDIALVEFEDFFVQNIIGDKEREILATKHQGLKFASKFQEAMSVYSPAKHKRLLRIYDVANIFAFDCLIYNVDRGRREDKPNLLVEDDNYLLIDHEQCFPFINTHEVAFYDSIMSKLANSELNYYFQGHLFYSTIKSYHYKAKEDVFAEFEVYLSKLNINKIRNIISKLIELNVSVGYYQRLIDYLCYLKDHSHKFCQTLLACTS